MAEPVSWLAVLAIKTLVEGITIANGYRTDLGQGAIVVDDSQLPEGAEPITIIDASTFDGLKTTRSRLDSDMTISIEFCIPRGVGTTNPKLLAHRGRADLISALMLKEQDLPPCMRSLEVIGSELMGFTDEEAASNFVIAQVTARAGLTELKSPAN